MKVDSKTEVAVFKCSTWDLVPWFNGPGGT